jgi:hypothetical protein
VSELVDPTGIEAIVGVSRHATEHYGRAVSAEQRVYILHSAECRDSGRDLRECPFSIALDRGIEHDLPRPGWRSVQDRPVRLEIAAGYLVPDFETYRAALVEAIAQELCRTSGIPDKPCNTCQTRAEGVADILERDGWNEKGRS